MRDLLDIDSQLNMSEQNTDERRCLRNLPLAYAYVPYQTFEKTYDKPMALDRGTIFPALDKPFDVYGNEWKSEAML